MTQATTTKAPAVAAPAVASPELATALRKLAEEIGERAAREQTGLSRAAYARLVARLHVRAGTIAQAERGLERSKDPPAASR
jgi:hypothetical protein